MRHGFSIPETHGARGGGLGNEVIPWAKAFIASQELGLRLLHPAWGLNKRQYRRDFGTSRTDWISRTALKTALPTVRITDTMVRQTGEADYALALRVLGPELNLPRNSPVVALHQGMSGGYYGIQRARDFLHHELSRPRHVSQDLYAISKNLDPERLTIAFHVRAQDFRVGSEAPAPGQFNMALPSDWYEAVLSNFVENFGDTAQYVILSDARESPLLDVLEEYKGVVTLPDRDRPLLSDLFCMVNADTLVCSVSSFSMLAAFLSDKPYIWFAAHLNDHGGWRSLWGHEEWQQPPDGLTARNLAVSGESPDPIVGRGIPVGMDGRLTDSLLELLQQKAFLKRRRHDLLYYGIAPSEGDR
jgi:hypothetical protein